jgi:hypothetical protein
LRCGARDPKIRGLDGDEKEASSDEGEDEEQCRDHDEGGVGWLLLSKPRSGISIR